MTRLTLLVLACLMVVLGTAAAFGAEKAVAEKPAAAPKAGGAAKPAAEEPAEKPAAATKADKMVAVVKVAVGTVETRSAVGKPWAPVKVGMKLAEGADLRTGFRARCILDMTDSLVQIDPLTVIRIGELRKEGQKVRTRLYMKHGNTQAVVEKGRIESDFAIVTPSATMSVRGTENINVGFFPVFGGSYGLGGPGLIAVRDAMLGRETTCAPGENTDDNATSPIEMLAQLYLPIIIDTKGLEPDEQVAVGRWHTSSPIPAGLQGGGGTGSQETDPDDDSTPGGGAYRGDITKPPNGSG